MIRVIAGSAHGRKLFGPKGLEFRPTTGRVKEYIFSVLGPEVVGAVFLDLFSGSGSLGIEAISRGAERVTFIEGSRGHLSLLERNIKMCGFEDSAQVIKDDVFRRIRALGIRGEKFDYILADPPFKASLLSQIVRTVEESRILAEDGVLMVEHEAHDLDPGDHGLSMLKEKRFGHCVVSLYQTGLS